MLYIKKSRWKGTGLLYSVHDCSWSHRGLIWLINFSCIKLQKPSIQSIGRSSEEDKTVLQTDSHRREITSNSNNISSFSNNFFTFFSKMSQRKSKLFHYVNFLNYFYLHTQPLPAYCFLLPANGICNRYLSHFVSLVGTFPRLIIDLIYVTTSA